MVDVTAARQGWDWDLWGRWVAANAVGELIGLGGSALALAGLLALVDEESTGGLLIMAALAIVFGTLLEGVVVGLFQWRVLRRAFPRITRREWVGATALGAGIAWILGMLPSTILSLTMEASPTPDAPVQEPGTAVILMLAAAMGFVLGAILAAPQWRVLRRHATGAGWWVPANMLAWAVGMPLIFLGTTAIPASGVTVGVALLLLASVLAAGAAVGAVHGLVLVRLAEHAATSRKD